jgi:hypothetical protein
MVNQSIALDSLKPNNFRLIFSYGGKEDSQIDTDKHYHSKVFESIDELSKNNYVDGTHDDTVAALGTSRRIGLVYHGIKGFKKTNWDKV